MKMNFYLESFFLMSKLITYVRLVATAIRKGSIRSDAIDFRERRLNALRDLMEFVPPSADAAKYRTPQTQTDSVWNYLVGQAAFIRRSVLNKGGHLPAPAIKLAYIRIPKVASTALSWTILCARYPGLKKYSLSAEQMNFLADVNLTADIMPEKDGQMVFFTAVRNPFSRIVSVYRQFFERPAPFFLYEDYLFGIMNKRLSFAEFINAVQSIPDRLKDQHFRPQHRFISFYTSRSVDVKIFKVEEHEALGRFLSSKQLTLTPLNQSDVNYDYRSYYDRDTLNRVYDIYRNDIISFGYEENYRALQRSVDEEFDRSLPE
jgi:hypothetical protein